MVETLTQGVLEPVVQSTELSAVAVGEEIMEKDSQHKVAAVKFKRGFMNQFVFDFWRELRRYDPIIALLVAFDVFSPSDSDFKVRRRVRVILLALHVTLAASLAVKFGCNPALSTAVKIIITMICVTIPMEILNVIWFNLYITRQELSSSKKGAKMSTKCLLHTRKLFAQVLGVVFTLATFVVAVSLLILASVDGSCKGDKKSNIVWKVILLQFLFNPALMSLPYWRRQSFLLSLLGQGGPVIGLLMHFYKYGLNPPPNDDEDDAKKCDDPAAPKETDVKKDAFQSDKQEKDNNNNNSPACVNNPLTLQHAEVVGVVVEDLETGGGNGGGDMNACGKVTVGKGTHSNNTEGKISPMSPTEIVL